MWYNELLKQSNRMWYNTCTLHVCIISGHNYDTRRATRVYHKRVRTLSIAKLYSVRARIGPFALDFTVTVA